MCYPRFRTTKCVFHRLTSFILVSMKTVRICISKPFREYGEQIAEIPKKFNRSSSTLHLGRNVIKKLEIKQTSGERIDIVVKAFATPGRLKGFIHANILQSKAKCSKINAEHLLEMGIPTPAPIASIEELNFHCIQHSFYACRFWYHNYDLGASLYRGEAQGLKSQLLLEKLVPFTLEQHNKGILHLDYNPGNILVRVRGEKIEFSLVDLNRLKFKMLEMEDRINGLVRLSPIKETINKVGMLYSNNMGIEQDYFCKRLLQEHQKFWDRRLRLEKMFRFLKKKQR